MLKYSLKSSGLAIASFSSNCAQNSYESQCNQASISVLKKSDDEKVVHSLYPSFALPLFQPPYPLTIPVPVRSTVINYNTIQAYISAYLKRILRWRNSSFIFLTPLFQPAHPPMISHRKWITSILSYLDPAEPPQLHAFDRKTRHYFNSRAQFAFIVFLFTFQTTNISHSTGYSAINGGLVDVER